MKKRIYNILKIGFIFGFLASIGLYFFMIHSWKFHLTETELSALITDIKQAEELPENFYELYNLSHDESLTNEILTQEFRSIFSGYRKPTISLSVSQFYLKGHHKKYYKNTLYTAHSLALKIEEKTTKRACLNWMMHSTKFLNTHNGIKSASSHYFGKEVTKLTDKELAILVIISQNKTLYNPARRPELLKKKVEHLLHKRAVANQ